MKVWLLIGGWDYEGEDGRDAMLFESKEDAERYAESKSFNKFARYNYKIIREVEINPASSLCPSQTLSNRKAD